MTHYQIDERDILFNLLECPGTEALSEVHPSDGADRDTARMIYEQSASFCQKVFAPLHDTTDREGCRFEDGQVQVPASMKGAWDQYRALGLIGMMASAEFGGAELPHFFSAPVAELECGSCVSLSMLPLLTRGAANLIATFGSDALKATYLEKMYSGEWTGTMCLTEPGAGSDVGASTTRATPRDGHYMIEGTKIFITWGDHDLSDNIVHLVLARTPDAPAGTKGLSLFVVPKFLVDENGTVGARNDVSCGSIEHKMGIKASPTCVMNFGSQSNCVGTLVGSPNQGMAQMFQMMNTARIEVGIQGLAQGSAAYLSARAYARDRKQGAVKTESGYQQVSISHHPDVMRMLANMKALTEGSRAIAYHLALYEDLAHYHLDRAQLYQGLVDLLTPICKSYGSDQGFRVTEMAIQTYGGYGYCQDYPVEQYMRDVKIASIYEGTNGIQALDLVFRKILGSKGTLLRDWVKTVKQFLAQIPTELSGIGQLVDGGVDALVDTATWFGTSAKTDVVQFNAVPFQEAMGHVVAAFYLLKQAAFAVPKRSGGDPFYAEKIQTAHYFAQTFLASAVSQLAHIRKGDRSGLAFDFSS